VTTTPTPRHQLGDAARYLIVMARHYAASEADPRRLESLWGARQALADERDKATADDLEVVLAGWPVSEVAVVRAALAVNTDVAADVAVEVDPEDVDTMPAADEMPDLPPDVRAFLTAIRALAAA
jgi:hypothetical protein